MKRKNMKTKVIYGVLILLTINLIIYILYGAKALLNSDSTFIVDYANEQIRKNTLFPLDWINTNDFWIYSLIPTINILLRFGVNYFFSRQISVLIQSIFLIILVIKLFKTEMKSKNEWFIFIFLLISGISGQFLFEIFGDGTYGSIIFYMILELLLFIKYMKTQNLKILLAFSSILGLLTMCSLRFPIYIGAPILCCVFYYIYVDGFSTKNRNLVVAVVLSIIIGYILNTILRNNLVIYSNVNDVLTNDYNRLAASIKQMIFNYFWLCGSTGLGIRSLSYHTTINFINVSSPLIVIVFVKFIYAIMTLIIPFNLRKKFANFNDGEKIVYIFTVSFSIIIIFFITIGGLYRWYRYVTPIIFFLNLLYPIFYKYINDNKNKKIFLIYVCLSVLSSLIISISSYYDYKSMSFKENNYQKITNFLVNKNLKHGYVYEGKEQNLYTFLSEGQIQINSIRKEDYQPAYWMNSKEWFTSEYYNDKVFFMRKNNQKELKIENKAIKTYEYLDYKIFIFNSNSEFFEYLNIMHYYTK